MLVDALDNLTKCLCALPTTSPQAERWSEQEFSKESESSIDDCFSARADESKQPQNSKAEA